MTEDYIVFDKSKQEEFKKELSELLAKYGITIEVVFSGSDIYIDSIDFCDICGRGLEHPPSEITKESVFEMMSI